MKEGWEYMKLGEVCEILNGFAFKSSNYVDCGIRIIRITNVQKGIIVDNSPKYYPLSEENNLNKYILKKNDLLMSLTGNVGRVGLLPKGLTPAALNQRVACIRMKNDNLSKTFLFHYLNSNSFEQLCIENASGAAQLNLSTVWLSNVQIPVPPISDQQRIVSYLDSEFAKIEALKANAETQLQAAKDLFQKALKELLTPKEGWEIESIGNVFKSYSGGTPIKSHQEYYDNATIPWLNSGEVCQKYITSTNNYISELGLKNSSAKFFPVNTVLIAMYGATAAQAGILKFEATSNQAVCGLLPTKEMLPEFVYYWFLHNKTEFASMAQGGAQPNLSQVKIKAMPIPVIEIEQQQSICDKLNTFEQKVKQLQDNYNETITLCNDLKQSLLKKIFE